MLSNNKFSRSIPLSSIKITDVFWGNYMETVRTKMIPYQWEALNDNIEGAEPSHCIENFLIAAGKKQGAFKGMVFQDSDIYKWIEAVAYSLIWHPDSDLEKIADGAIDIICDAQQKDGYLNTYYIINGLDKRFTNIKENHELYCLGHMIEAAVAYFQATGETKLLDAAVKYVDCVDSIFGNEENKLNGYPGHEVIEMALVKLYEVTSDQRYLYLSHYFVHQRGKEPLYFAEEDSKYENIFPWKDSYFKYQYYQAGKSIFDQEKAEGHAVRAVYLYSAIADLAREYNDEKLFEQCEVLWTNMTGKRMYITGGIGSSNYGEAFTYDYDLPNDTVYAETCASVGLMFFAKRMFEISHKSKYIDIMEYALYNTVLSGVSLDGTRFFYVNPLEVIPEACEKDHLRNHVKVTRQNWFTCSCCPPNIARLIASIGSYAYSMNDSTFFLNLFIGGNVEVNINNSNVKFEIVTGYPWNGDVLIRVKTKSIENFTFAIRKPEWCKTAAISVDDSEFDCKEDSGYLLINRDWKDGAVISCSFEMEPELITSSLNVRENVGKAALRRGPIVYCLEEEDNGSDLHRVYIDKESEKFSFEYAPDLLNGVNIIRSDGKEIYEKDSSKLYKPDETYTFKERKLTWIPYYSWANRKPGEMSVWNKFF